MIHRGFCEPLWFLVVVFLTAMAVNHGQQVKASAQQLPGDETPMVCPAIQEILDLPAYQHAHWGLLLGDSESDTVLQSLNPNEMMEIASVTKMFTMAAAMDVWGVDKVFETPVVHTGELLLNNGTLNGDLILVAQGDLTMGGRNKPDGTIEYTVMDHVQSGRGQGQLGMGILTSADPLSGLDYLAQQVKEAGVNHVSGNVVIDDRLFPSFHFLEYAYGGRLIPISPIVINDNLVDVIFEPTLPGQAAVVTLRPQTVAYRIQGNVVTRDQPQLPVTVGPVKGADGVTTLYVDGEIATDAQYPMITFDVGNVPELNEAEQLQEVASLARTLFIEALYRAGVHVEATVLGPNPSDKLPSSVAGLPQVCRLVSPPFSEYMKLILKTSHNQGCILTATLLGVAAGQQDIPSNDPPYILGMATLGHILTTSYGIDKNAYAFEDAGGQACFATPQVILDLLTKVEERPDFDAFREAHPILGVDGSLGTVNINHPAVGHVYGKVGSIQMLDWAALEIHVSSNTLAGYMDAEDGSRRRFFAGVSVASPGDSLLEGSYDGVLTVYDNVAQTSAEMWTTACVSMTYPHDSPATRVRHTFGLSWGFVVSILLAITALIRESCVR